MHVFFSTIIQQKLNIPDIFCFLFNLYFAVYIRSRITCSCYAHTERTLRAPGCISSGQALELELELVEVNLLHINDV